MKKIIPLLIFICSVLPGFAETGYNGYAWGRKRNSFIFGDKADSYKIDNFEIVSFGTNVLGRSTIKSYFFIDENLEGVTYYFLQQDQEELIQRFEDKKKIYEVKTKTNIYEYLISVFEYNDIEIPEYAKEDENGAAAFFLIIGESLIFEQSQYIKKEGYKKTEEDPEATGKLYIYDYNDDTRVYIITEGLDGIGFVTYLPQYKDY